MTIEEKRKWFREKYGYKADDLTVATSYSTFSRINSSDLDNEKPKQYRKGIDTFERIRRNMSIEGIKNTTTATVDAYIWRDKGTDYEDFCKARDWLNFCIEAIEEHNKKENK